MNPRPSAFLFDLDGALLQDAPGRPPYEGVREMLAALSSAGYPLGLVTCHPGEALGDLGPFELVITGDDGLLPAAEGLGGSAGSVAFIGRAPADLAAARALGMPIGAALWPGDGAPTDADWRFDLPADLTRTFARWC